MKFKKAKPISGERAFIVLSKYPDISYLDLSGFKINAEYEYWIKTKDGNEFDGLIASKGTSKILLGPCRIIPIIIPWGPKFYEDILKISKRK